MKLGRPDEPQDMPDDFKDDRYMEPDTPTLSLSQDGLADVLEYCCLMARCVSSSSASTLGLRHDGAVVDFLRELVLSMRNGEEFNMDDEFNRSVFERMREDITH